MKQFRLCRILFAALILGSSLAPAGQALASGQARRGPTRIARLGGFRNWLASPLTHKTNAPVATRTSPSLAPMAAPARASVTGPARDASALSDENAPLQAAATPDAPSAETAEPFLGRLYRLGASLSRLWRVDLPGNLNELMTQGGSAPAGAFGFRPQTEPIEINGVELRLGRMPAAPDPGRTGPVVTHDLAIPGSRTIGGNLSTPRVIDADPDDMGSVELAIRRLIDSDVPTFGVSTSELALDNPVNKVPGRHVPGLADQADAIYLRFWQHKNGIRVQDSSLSFTLFIEESNGARALKLYSYQGKTFPDIQLTDTAPLPEERLIAAAREHLRQMGVPDDTPLELLPLEEVILYVEDAWRVLKMYSINGYPVVIAVEVSTGKVFSWDNRIGAAARMELAAGWTMAARLEGNDKRDKDGGPLLNQFALPLLKVRVKLPDGQFKDVETDAQGRFTVPELAEGQEVEFQAVLSGRYVTVNNKAGEPIRLSGAIRGGETKTLVFNSEGADQKTVAQVNAYYWYSYLITWWSREGAEDAKIKGHVPANVNIPSSCNAYYTPGNPSTNFFQASKECANTAKPGVILHEGGHHIITKLAGPFANRGYHEGGADYFSMAILRSPMIGENFLLGRNPSWIRDGRNVYQYRSSDEEHDQGQAFMGFGWKLYENLFKTYADEDKAWTIANSLVLAVVYAGAKEIPAILAQVLLRDMDKEGKFRHENEIRAAAKAHGIDLPSSTTRLELLARWAFDRFRHVRMIESRALPQALGSAALAVSMSVLPQSQGFATQPKLITRQVAFEAGARTREQLRREIESVFGFIHGEYLLYPEEWNRLYPGFRPLSKEIQEEDGRLIVTITGLKRSVEYAVEQLRRINVRHPQAGAPRVIASL